MKKIITGLLILFSFSAGTSQGEEYTRLSANAFNVDINAYRAQVASKKRGYLETSKLSIGTILRSHHFADNDYDYNETHNGIYLNVERWSIGSYLNSGYEQSVFVTYNPTLYTGRTVGVNLVAGVANGYEGWDYAQNGYLPLVGVSAQWMYLKTMLSFDVVAVGFELPLN
jgi:hypothetical protein